MTIEPEDLISPEEEAEIHRNSIRGHGMEVLEVVGRMIEHMKAHPETRDPRAVDFLSQALASHERWLRENGVGLSQPDVDDPK